ncbi:ATP-binding protein [filamentous cyanobacterium CCP1]|nr:ATP-binding protein [filamentous cyanobacterium CCP1]
MQQGTFFFPSQIVPPEYFVGRSNEIATAFDQISGNGASRGHLAIWGGTGMGKSSFLELLTAPQVWQWHNQDHTNAVIVKLSCWTLAPFTPAAFWREVLSLFQDELAAENPLYGELKTLLAEEPVTVNHLRQALKQLGQQGKFLLLLAGDYDVALRPNASYSDEDMETFLNDCRNLASHHREKKFFSMVVTTLRPLDTLGPEITPDRSPWFNHYLYLSLGPLTDVEVDALLSGMPMTPALKEVIRQIAGGNPTLLQNAGYVLYSRLRVGKVPTAEEFFADFLDRTQQYFRKTWAVIDEVERTLLMLIALSGLKGRLRNRHYDLGDVDRIFSQKERELIDLSRWGVVVRKMHQSKVTYSFASSVMEWWVIKEIEELAGDTQKTLEDRQKVFLNLMSKKQATQVTNAILYLWDHREEIPAIAEWLGKLAGAFSKGFVA